MTSGSDRREYCKLAKIWNKTTRTFVQLLTRPMGRLDEAATFRLIALRHRLTGRWDATNLFTVVRPCSNHRSSTIQRKEVPNIFRVTRFYRISLGQLGDVQKLLQNFKEGQPHGGLRPNLPPVSSRMFAWFTEH